MLSIESLNLRNIHLTSNHELCHSIAMATHPGMIEYFSMAPKEGLTETMLAGGTMLLFNTEDVQKHIMKWCSGLCPFSRLYRTSRIKT